jgi:Uri superfamily endonuclease
MYQRNIKGSYILIISLQTQTGITIGKLGEIDFAPGWYAYVGSAMRGIESRVSHHLRKNDKSQWHIDYLLQKSRIDRVLTFESDHRNECNIAQALMRRLDYIPGFGCSDCRCKSHLFYSKNTLEFGFLENRRSL